MEQAGESARSIAGEASGAASSVVDTAKEESRALAHETKDQARVLLDDVRSTTKHEVDSQVARVGDGLHRLGSEFESMASASSEPDRLPAEFARRVGSGLDSVAQKIEREGLDGIVDDAKRYARQNPMVFLMGAAAAGFVIGRVVRNMDRRRVIEVAKDHASGQSDSQGELPEPQAFSPDPSLLDQRTQEGIENLDEPFARPTPQPTSTYAGMSAGDGHG